MADSHRFSSDGCAFDDAPTRSFDRAFVRFVRSYVPVIADVVRGGGQEGRKEGTRAKDRAHSPFQSR